MTALKAILTVFSHPLSSSHITSALHIDNLGVVRRSQDTPFSIQQCLQPDWDIMHAAYNIRLSLPAIITVLHVQSHQDNTTADLISLPLSAHLNIVADSETHQTYKTRPHFQQTPSLPSSQATLVLNGSRVISKMTAHASLAYYRPIMADYFHQKFGWDNITFSNIDWGTLEKEYCCLSQAVAWHLSNVRMACGQPTRPYTNKNKHHPSPLFLEQPVP